MQPLIFILAQTNNKISLLCKMSTISEKKSFTFYCPLDPPPFGAWFESATPHWQELSKLVISSTEINTTGLPYNPFYTPNVI
jgi:hypothetical protein